MIIFCDGIFACFIKRPEFSIYFDNIELRRRRWIEKILNDMVSYHIGEVLFCDPKAFSPDTRKFVNNVYSQVVEILTKIVTDIKLKTPILDQVRTDCMNAMLFASIAPVILCLPWWSGIFSIMTAIIVRLVAVTDNGVVVTFFDAINIILCYFQLCIYICYVILKKKQSQHQEHIHSV